jgi:nicotinate-nucleotide pyrophosphorylase (carboxylating)
MIDYNWDQFIKEALDEDIKGGDHTSLSCVPENGLGSAKLLVKEDCIIAGVSLAEKIIKYYDSNLTLEVLITDGNSVKAGDIIFHLKGKSRNILSIERLLLNCMQRMSGVATLTKKFIVASAHTRVKILDTRKTTPLFRAVEKWAVTIGGGHNHRFGLYDMMMIKDNHIDYAGGIKQAIERANEYQRKNNLNLAIEIETRNLNELEQVLSIGAVNRIMLDNYKLEDIRTALKMISNKYETEISGGVTLETVKEFAETGVDYISVGALTHSYKSVDLSLKAEFNFQT